MRNEETLLDMANTNYKTSRILLENRQDDERILCSVGYHLQQTVELAIKHFLEAEGYRDAAEKQSLQEYNERTGQNLRPVTNEELADLGIVIDW